MAQVNLTPLSEIVDEVWGEVGTPERDQMENQLKEELNAYHQSLRLGAKIGSGCPQNWRAAE